MHLNRGTSNKFSTQVALYLPEGEVHRVTLLNTSTPLYLNSFCFLLLFFIRGRQTECSGCQVQVRDHGGESPGYDPPDSFSLFFLSFTISLITFCIYCKKYFLSVLFFSLFKFGLYLLRNTK